VPAQAGDHDPKWHIRLADHFETVELGPRKIEELPWELAQAKSWRLLQRRGDLSRAMALHKEKERICRELGTPERLAASLANQASLLDLKIDRPEEALPLADEAERLVTDHGLHALAEQIKPILDRARSAQP